MPNKLIFVGASNSLTFNGSDHAHLIGVAVATPQYSMREIRRREPPSLPLAGRATSQMKGATPEQDNKLIITATKRVHYSPHLLKYLGTMKLSLPVMVFFPSSESLRHHPTCMTATNRKHDCSFGVALLYSTAQ